jgi:hypothetical protein
MLWINKIYLILLISNYQEFEPKMEDRIRILKFLFDAIATKMGYFLNLINEFVTKSSFNLKRLFPIVIEK